MSSLFITIVESAHLMRDLGRHVWRLVNVRRRVLRRREQHARQRLAFDRVPRRQLGHLERLTISGSEAYLELIVSCDLRRKGMGSKGGSQC